MRERWQFHRRHARMQNVPLSGRRGRGGRGGEGGGQPGGRAHPRLDSALPAGRGAGGGGGEAGWPHRNHGRAPSTDIAREKSSIAPRPPEGSPPGLRDAPEAAGRGPLGARGCATGGAAPESSLSRSACTRSMARRGRPGGLPPPLRPLGAACVAPRGVSIYSKNTHRIEKITFMFRFNLIKARYGGGGGQGGNREPRREWGVFDGRACTRRDGVGAFQSPSGGGGPPTTKGRTSLLAPLRIQYGEAPRHHFFPNLSSRYIQQTLLFKGTRTKMLMTVGGQKAPGLWGDPPPPLVTTDGGAGRD